jgi:hypothetical protein
VSELPGLVFGVREIYSGKREMEMKAEKRGMKGRKIKTKNVIMRMKCRSDCPENTDNYIGPSVCRVA